MNEAFFRVPQPQNEPVLSYAPGSQERRTLESQIKSFRSSQLEIPLIVGGEEIRTGVKAVCVEPHNHRSVIAEYHQADEKIVEKAIAASLKAKKDWERLSWHDRAAVFLKAADLLATKYRPVLNAATMLNQSKSCHQAEIDSACELIDFFRFNAAFMQQIYADQPISSPGIWNRLEYRPLEGFVAAITPFNFTAIAGNLNATPAMLGNVTLWKPAGTAVFSGYWIMKILEEAGLPPGVINFIPGPASKIADTLLKDRHLAGVHFTGSTGVFQQMWKTIGNNIASYHGYPRIVGETGGKDFVFVHESANTKEVATALVRGAFEYQGQKCSAASRAYIPRSLWNSVRDEIGQQLSEIKMGDVSDFSCYVNAVIDEKSFDKLSSHIDAAKKSSDSKIVFGGKYNKETGYFIEPTVIEATNPKYVTMCEELFGPVLTVHVYDNAKLDETLALCDSTSPYALTGAIFAKDRRVVQKMTDALKNAAGNFYINDKPTGAVVGQQPFGGARASGTNDKAGSLWNLIRWISPRSIKETFVPPENYRYPFLG